MNRKECYEDRVSEKENPHADSAKNKRYKTSQSKSPLSNPKAYENDKKKK